MGFDEAKIPRIHQSEKSTVADLEEGV